MTIQYDDNFGKHLLRWNGSIWKSTWKELVLWLGAYYVIRILYQFILTETQKDIFERISLTIDQYLSIMPVTFILGFYISIIVTRWWSQFELVPWPDQTMAVSNIVFQNHEPHSTLKRELIGRYLNLAALLVWQQLSPRIKRIYPTVQSLVNHQLMTVDEYKLYKQVKIGSCRWSLPLEWSQRLIEDHIRAHNTPPQLTLEFIRCINNYRMQLHNLFCYDWVCIPLVYTQVTSLATYAFFLLCLIGRQFLDPSKEYSRSPVDLYFPVFTLVQFMFYVGWLKVGADLMRPFGTDDDDIDLDQIVERNLAYANCQVLQVSQQNPNVYLNTMSLEKPPRPGDPTSAESIQRMNVILDIDNNNNQNVETIEEKSTENKTPQPISSIKRTKLRF